MTQPQITVKIQRYDPTTDPAPYYQSYTLPFEEGMSVLDVLDYIFDNLDSSLAYFNHAACRRGVCVRCNVRVNGSPVLACQAIATANMNISPLRDPVTRDLVFESIKSK